MVSSDYSQLFTKEYKGNGDCCKLCNDYFEHGTLQFTSKKDIFHYFCLFSNSTFTGRVEDIRGFSEISRDHQDLLRSNSNTEVYAEESDLSEESDSEDYLLDLTMTPESSENLSVDLKTKLKMEVEEPKNKEKLNYEAVLNTVFGETGNVNPEFCWPLKENDPTEMEDILNTNIPIDQEHAVPHIMKMMCHILPTDKGFTCYALGVAQELNVEEILRKPSLRRKKQWLNLNGEFPYLRGDFETLTANKWRNRQFFQQKEAFMTMVGAVYKDTLKSTADLQILPGGSSQLPSSIKMVLLNIFGKKNIKTLVDEKVNVDSMPVGNLTVRQVSHASSILNDIIEVKMRYLLDDLLHLEYVCNIIREIRKEAGAKGMDPLDLHYSRLGTHMEVVQEDSDEFMLVNRYIQNGLGHTHNYKKITLMDLIKMDRYAESRKFNADLGNRKLLWHGSSIKNFPGILTQGLRIAPPDAVQAGKAFGRGVYFADMISKSANYCRSDDIGYLLLCDVALGKMKKENYGNGRGLGKPAYNSIKGTGLTGPDPKGNFHHPDGFTIPLGSVKTKTGFWTRRRYRLEYNEYIVYDLDQIRCRYLVRVKFN